MRARDRFAVVLLMLGTAAFSHSTDAEYAQQGNKLVGTGAVGKAGQGASASVSADGNTLIVGGPADNHSRGATWVFTRAGGPWTQLGNKLVGSGATENARQGASVAISSDGNTAIVGGPDDHVLTGAAWIFVRSGGVWTQQGKKLVGGGAEAAAVGLADTTAPGVGQGESVAISSDGNTAIVGGKRDHLGVGAAWVFARTAGVWAQQGGKLVGADADGDAAEGVSVAVSGDGNTAIVGGYNDQQATGAAWVYTRAGAVWTQQGSKLVGTPAAFGAGTSQGYAVSLSYDGNTAIVGGFYDNRGAGAAWVFTRSGGVWTQHGSKLVGTGGTPYAMQGVAVSLSSDGNTAIIGGDEDSDNTGAAWIFTRSGGVWTQQGSKLVGGGAVGEAYQGSSVSLSSDGHTAIVSGFGDRNAGGAVWVFIRN